MNKEFAVLFDMDGVICHTNPYHSLAFREFFSTRDVNPSDDEFAAHMFGKSNSYIMSHFLKRKIEGDELLTLEEEKEGLFRKIYSAHVEPIKGIVPFINDLHSHGVKLGVATSAPYANMELILNTLLIGGMFSSLLASENVKKHKPDPEVYLSSAKSLGIKPEQCIVFEDSYSGITAGINAGMKVIGVLSSHRQDELPPCEFYINDFTELSYHRIKEMI